MKPFTFNQFKFDKYIYSFEKDGLFTYLYSVQLRDFKIIIKIVVSSLNTRETMICHNCSLIQIYRQRLSSPFDKRFVDDLYQVHTKHVKDT